MPSLEGADEPTDIPLISVEISIDFRPAYRWSKKRGTFLTGQNFDLAHVIFCENNFWENISLDVTFLSRQTEFGHNFGLWRNAWTSRFTTIQNHVQTHSDEKVMSSQKRSLFLLLLCVWLDIGKSIEISTEVRVASPPHAVVFATTRGSVRNRNNTHDIIICRFLNFIDTFLRLST